MLFSRDAGNGRSGELFLRRQFALVLEGLREPYGDRELSNLQITIASGEASHRVNREMLGKSFFPSGGKDERTPRVARLHPAKLAEALEHCRADCPGDVRTPFAPVETGTADAPVSPSQQVDIDSEPRKQGASLVLEFNVAALRRILQQAFAKLDGNASCEMIVARSKLTHAGILRARSKRARRCERCSCDVHLLEKLGNFAASDPVIAVTTLLVNDHHLRRRKLCEVAACRLRRDSSGVGKLARRSRAPV